VGQGPWGGSRRLEAILTFQDNDDSTAGRTRAGGVGRCHGIVEKAVRCMHVQSIANENEGDTYRSIFLGSCV